MAEVFLLLAVTLVPVATGAAASLLRKPWWWAAAAAVVVAMIAAVAPEPEVGEARVAPVDLGFLLVVALWVTGLAWLGSVATRRLRVSRRPT